MVLFQIIFQLLTYFRALVLNVSVSLIINRGRNKEGGGGQVCLQNKTTCVYIQSRRVFLHEVKIVEIGQGLKIQQTAA